MFRLTLITVMALMLLLAYTQAPLSAQQPQATPPPGVLTAVPTTPNQPTPPPGVLSPLPTTTLIPGVVTPQTSPPPGAVSPHRQIFLPVIRR